MEWSGMEWNGSGWMHRRGWQTAFRKYCGAPVVTNKNCGSSDYRAGVRHASRGS